MRFFYADPGLRSDLGHHANLCRHVIGELRARGIDYRVLAYERIDPSLSDQLEAVPYFHYYTYQMTDGDPISGWLNAFHAAADNTHADLARIDIGAGDLMYLSSVQPGVALGVFQWMSATPVNRLPHVVMEFGTDPGMDIEFTASGARLITRDPRADPRGPLYRFAATRFPTVAASHLHMVTLEPNSSIAYGALMRQPVGVLPLPQQALDTVQNRAGRRPITVSVMGHQRPDKGYQLMPDIATRLLQNNPSITVLAHNGDPDGMKDAQHALTDLAAHNDRLVIDERIAGPAIWNELLTTSDIILCPYYPPRFAISYSGVAAEAIANAIPLVAPARTSLARLLNQFGNPGTTFDSFDAESIAAATQLAIDNFDEVAARAFAAAQRWPEVNGPHKMVEAILRLADETLA